MPKVTNRRLQMIQESLERIERQMSPEIHTLTTVTDANRLFKRLLRSIKKGQGIELIVRKI